MYINYGEYHICSKKVSPLGILNQRLWDDIVNSSVKFSTCLLEWIVIFFFISTISFHSSMIFVKFTGIILNIAYAFFFMRMLLLSLEGKKPSITSLPPAKGPSCCIIPCLIFVGPHITRKTTKQEIAMTRFTVSQVYSIKLPCQCYVIPTRLMSAIIDL